MSDDRLPPFRERYQYSKLGVPPSIPDDHSSPSSVLGWSLPRTTREENFVRVFGTAVCQLCLYVPELVAPDLFDDDHTPSGKRRVRSLQGPHVPVGEVTVNDDTFSKLNAFSTDEQEVDKERAIRFDLFWEKLQRMMEDESARTRLGIPRRKSNGDNLSRYMRGESLKEWKTTATGVVLCNPRICEWAFSLFDETDEEEGEGERDQQPSPHDGDSDASPPKGHILTCRHFLPPDFDFKRLSVNRDFRFWMHLPSPRREGFRLSLASPLIELGLEHLKQGSLKIQKVRSSSRHVDLVLISIARELFPPQSVMMVPLPFIDPDQFSMQLPERKLLRPKEYSVLSCGYPTYYFFKAVDAEGVMRGEDIFGRRMKLEYVLERFADSKSIEPLRDSVDLWKELRRSFGHAVEYAQSQSYQHISSARRGNREEATAARACHTPMRGVDELIRILDPRNDREMGIAAVVGRILRWERPWKLELAKWQMRYRETEVRARVLESMTPLLSKKSIGDRLGRAWNTVLRAIADAVRTEFFPGPRGQDELLKMSEGRLPRPPSSSYYPETEGLERVRVFGLQGPGCSGSPLLAKKADQTACNLSGFVGILSKVSPRSMIYSGLGRFVSLLYKNEVLPDVKRVMDQLRRQKRGSVSRVLLESLEPQIDRLEEYFKFRLAQRSRGVRITT